MTQVKINEESSNELNDELSERNYILDDKLNDKSSERNDILSGESSDKLNEESSMNHLKEMIYQVVNQVMN